MKKNLPLILIILVAAAANLLFFVHKNNKITADTNTPNSTGSGAVQTVYRAGVPQVAKDGSTLTNYDPGKSFFPIGIYHTNSADELSSVMNPGTGFNMAIPMGNFDNRIKGLLEQTSNTDFKIIPFYNPDYYFQGSILPSSPDTSKILSTFSTLEQNNTQKNLFGWYLFDEPLDSTKLGINGDLATGTAWKNFLDTLLTQIKARGVTKSLLAVNTANITAPSNLWYAFSTLGDIAALDNFPTDQKWVRNDPNLAIDSLDRPQNSVGGSSTISKTVSATVAKNKEQKPVWLVVESFKPKASSDGTPTRFPTPAEEKAFVYSGIIHGASGIVYFTYDDPSVLRTADKQLVGISPNPDSSLPAQDQVDSKSLWEAIAGQNGINAQINQLSPVLLSKTSKMDYSVSFQGNNIASSPIQTILKEYDDKYYLIAVNVDNTPITGNFSFPDGTFNSSSVQEIFENRVVTETNQRFNDDFTPFGVHVYSWDKNPNTISLLSGYNAISSTQPILAADLQNKGLTIFDFNQQGDRNWRMSRTSNLSIDKILPGNGYYVYSPSNQTVSASPTQDTSLGSVIRLGWNLVANSSDSPVKFSSISMPVIKTTAENNCTDLSCFDSTLLSQIPQRSYKKIVLIKNDQATDSSKAFEYNDIRGANADTLTIPPHTNFWFYLFR
jgi:hypothetical protein